MSDKKDTKKRKGRYAYLNDFKLNDNNEYEYKGNIYELDINSEDKSTLTKKSIILLSALVIVAIASGCLPFKGMLGAFYVIVPYTFEVIFSLLLIPCIYTVIRKNILREYEYKKSIERIKPYAGVVMIDSVLGLFTSVIYVSINGIEPVIVSILYILSKAVSFFIAKALVDVSDGYKYKQIQTRQE